MIHIQIVWMREVGKRVRLELSADDVLMELELGDENGRSAEARRGFAR